MDLIMETLMNFLLNIVVKIISDLGYLGVMFASLIESACIPLPSEIIFPFSGYLIYLGKFTFWGVMFYGMLGQILGSVITYWIGSLGALPVLEKYGKYLLIKKEDIIKAQKWFSKYGEGAVFWGRMMPVIRTFISLPAGIAKMNFWKFLIYTLIGCIPWLY
ncbi:MAG: DedA family protein, partial [Armatimonadetes bacterium]|nr:DedA family protein [Armatimonadota bacterium]